MTGKEIQSAVRKLGLRISDEMAEYVSRQVQSSMREIPIMGGELRTGVPMRVTIPLEQLSAAAEQRS